MIEARGLTKRYGDKVAVDNISFTVEPGTVTGFLGPNGAGKSTTMRMIMGLDKPTTGTVTVAEVQGPQRPTVHRRRPAGRQGPARIANGPHPPDAAGRVQRHPRQPG